MYFNESKVIAKKIDLYSNKEKNKTKELHISYGIDRNFLYGCGISIASILKNNTEIQFCFHIFTDYFDAQQEQLFTALAKQYNTSIKVYLINCEELKSLPSTKNWSYATYFRFIIADYFSENLDYIIYIDADIICKGSLDELCNIKFSQDSIAAVVTERDQSWWLSRANSLDIPSISEGYFNAGFLVINLSNWKKYKITENAMSLLSKDEIKNKISFLDQDILNILLTQKVIYLDRKYNTQYSINYELKKDKKINFITNDAILIHYIGPTKPWHEWANYPTIQPFLVAKFASPWKGIPLLKAKSSNHLRYCAKHNILNNKFISGGISYIKYFYSKLIK
ncbi:lipopolysaccharide 3-alpha-galactosyltransferase [Moellerella wisconsensis]|uniref:lipopolysaccharide 3-alpha-galactosyltransferase n=1 Tax=Moellerella wisconsensis TaxID=158849 RepID=UPI003076290B